MCTIKETSIIAMEHDTGMEQGLFRLLCLSAALLTLLVIVPVETAIELPTPVLLLDTGFGLTALCLYLQSRRERYLVKTLFFLYLTDLTCNWFAVNGSQGSIPFFYFNAFIYALIFFRGRQRWLLLVLAIVDVALLLVAESIFPTWTTVYPSTRSRLIDLAVTLILSAVSCTIMIWAVLSSYDKEQRRLRSLNADLERTIAERTEAEQSLRHNREMLNAVIEGTSDAIYAKDTEGRYILFNGGAARMTGRSAAQALGQGDSYLFSAEVAAIIEAMDREILASGEVRTLEHVLDNWCGEKVVVQATKGPLRDDKGRIVGVFGISRDVTENRRVENEIRMLNAELDQRVTERTVRLEAAIKEQESFCYSVSHDLRAPLRHINSYSAILMEECDECLTPVARDYLERIRSSSRSMGKLIDDLLELSKIGRSHLQESAVNLSDIAWKIYRGLQHVEPERKVEFRVERDLKVHGDRILLQQALTNLLDNAWKYTKLRDAACIELGKVAAGDQETFFVRDNGVGFDMAYRDKLFGAFQRLHGSEYAGTGIGLATVKRIVKRHGGKVWAEGAVDAGATVYFTLPGRGESLLTPGVLIGVSGGGKGESQASR